MTRKVVWGAVGAVLVMALTAEVASAGLFRPGPGLLARLRCRRVNPAVLALQEERAKAEQAKKEAEEAKAAAEAAKREAEAVKAAVEKALASVREEAAKALEKIRQ